MTMAPSTSSRRSPLSGSASRSSRVSTLLSDMADMMIPLCSPHKRGLPRPPPAPHSSNCGELPPRWRFRRAGVSAVLRPLLRDAPLSKGRIGQQRSQRSNGDAQTVHQNEMATPTGLEPATSAVTGRRANQLRYGAKHDCAWPYPQRDSNPRYRLERAAS